MSKNKVIYEDEIDLRELFQIIWQKKLFILVFTLFITFFAGIYVFNKKPIYEVKSAVRIGYINGNLIEPSNILEQKLRLIYGVDIPREFTEDGIVSNISSVKKVDNFLEIVTQAFSNEKGLERNKDVVEFLQNEYKYKVDEFILRTQINIKNIEEQIKYLTEIEKINIEKNIEKIRQQQIPRIEKEIDLLKKVELKAINNKLEFNQQKLKEYQADVSKISKQKSDDNSQNMLMSIQLLNTQNLILSTQNNIENLIKEKENLINLKLKDLETKKQNIIDEDIREEEIKLNVNLVKKLDDLKNSLMIEKLKLTNDSVRNSEVVGDYIVNDYPVKPKKSLILIVSLVTGFILSIFIVFFLNFFREDKYSIL